MAITKLGNYELPLSSEERATLISYLAGFKREKMCDSIRGRLRHHLLDICSISSVTYKANEVGRIEMDITRRLAEIKDNINKDFPAAKSFFNEERWAFRIGFTSSDLPKVFLNEELLSFVMGGNNVNFDMSLIPDEEWIEEFKLNKYQCPGLMKITPEMQVYVKFNDRLNDFATNADYRDDYHDFTAIIEEIAKAAKEGKL